MKPGFVVLLAANVLLLLACGSDERSAASEAPISSSSEHGDDHGSEEAAGHAEDGDAHEEAGDGDKGHVELTPDQLTNAGIKLAEAGPAEIRETLSLYGVMAPNAERVREVTARYPGAIRSVSKRVGDSVQQGQTLARVESNESLQTYAVVAPLSGVVTARDANPGEQTGDKALFTVADLSTVWVEVSVFPRDLARIRVGQPVRVSSAGTNLKADGKVIYVAPIGSSSNQTLTARVLLDNAAKQWPPGLYVTAEVGVASVSAPVAVSSGALQMVEERNVVFVHEEDGFAARPVRLGRSDGEFTEVTDGLRAGESYVAHNSFILKSELGKGEAEHEH